MNHRKAMPVPLVLGGLALVTAAPGGMSPMIRRSIRLLLGALLVLVTLAISVPVASADFPSTCPGPNPQSGPPNPLCE